MPMCPHCRSHLGCIHCRTAPVAPRPLEEKRDLGVVCGRLYSPAWLIARAARNERAHREDIFDYPIQKPTAGFGTSVLPANFRI